jgi:hypothetical protein
MMNPARRTLLQRAGILFLSFYLFLFMFPFPLDQIPLVSVVFDYYAQLQDFLTNWFGKSVLHLHNFHKTENTGSGDTLFSYVTVFSQLTLAMAFTILVLLADRKKHNYTRVYAHLITYARYYLGLFMLLYGSLKFADPGQFDTPGLFTLEKSFGNLSPAGLLWSFMGASKGFKVFSGLLELSGGYLLLFRRTQIIGALLTAVIMLQVAVMNFCYDVSVKLFSFHLFLIAFIILFPYLKRLLAFLLGLKHEPINYTPLEFDKKYKRILFYITKAGILIYFSAGYLLGPPSLLDVPGQDKTQHWIAGVYKPTLVVLDKDTLVTTQKDPMWKKLMLEDGFAAIGTSMDSLKYFKSILHEKDQTITFVSDKDSTEHYTLSYFLEKGKLTLTGNWKGKTLNAQFIRKTQKDYILLNRGFHLIEEYPFNDDFNHR